ncbi:MAG: tRNA (5-methylaminomethyl-2-thiouridine)(34)-methyltransferase MnmD [Bacteroidota bacterium]
MPASEIKHIITNDGSSTLYSPQYDEHYHSVHGAIQESMHVFIRMGLDALPLERKEIRILEMGFGTGLNALLSLLHRKDRKVHYTGLEAIPVASEMAAALNYPDKLGEPALKTPFMALHEAIWEEPSIISPGFSLVKHHTRLEIFQAEEGFDLIYFDAFAPNSQPELWTEDIMRRMYRMMRPGGIFVTYSAKSSVRRGLQSAGFRVEKLPGPPGKREMLRAIKDNVEA